MNYTPTHFLHYDDQENKWQQATLEELTMRNDPELYVIPVYENGAQGEQSTWSEYPAKQKEWESRQREEELKKRGALKYIAVYTPSHGWRRAKLDMVEILQPGIIKLGYENGTVEKVSWNEWKNTSEAEMFRVAEEIEAQKALQKAQEKKKEEELGAQQEWATNVFRLMLMIKELREDQLKTNKKLRTVCDIFLISVVVTAIGIIMGFLSAAAR